MAAQHLDAVLDMKSQRPFVPFMIRTIGGEEYPVRDRFQFAVRAPRVLLYVLPDLKRFVELTADQIVAVEPLAEKQSA